MTKFAGVGGHLLQERWKEDPMVRLQPLLLRPISEPGIADREDGARAEGGDKGQVRFARADRALHNRQGVGIVVGRKAPHLGGNDALDRRAGLAKERRAHASATCPAL